MNEFLNGRPLPASSDTESGDCVSILFMEEQEVIFGMTITNYITATGSRSVQQIRRDLLRLCCLKTVAKSKHHDAGGRYSFVSSKNRRSTLAVFCAHNLVGVLRVLILRVPGNATFRCKVCFVPTRANGAYALKREWSETVVYRTGS